MPGFLAVDWGALFIPRTPLLEMVARGTVVYLALFLLLRFALKRQSGTVGITDLLLVVLIADAAQNAMAGEYRSIPDGLVLVGTVVFWSYALDWLGYRYPRLRFIVHPPPLPLVKDGRMLRQNMKRELITEEELRSQLREQGVENVEEVRAAFIEGDGHLSVIKRQGKRQGGPAGSRRLRTT